MPASSYGKIDACLIDGMLVLIQNNLCHLRHTESYILMSVLNKASVEY